jgi:hypothetical protein
MNKFVYVVKKNADFTEGRGPMLLDSVWSDPDEAVKWVKQQGGIYGSEQRVELNKYGYYAYANGYQIEKMPLLDNANEMEHETAKQKALAKLTPEDRVVLGL